MFKIKDKYVPNIAWDILILKKLLFIRHSNLTGYLVFLSAQYGNPRS